MTKNLDDDKDEIVQTNGFYNLFNLQEGQDDKNKTLENIKANISFKGANLWILACAILVASVGLNVNSTAVIIGAMLISPLMGPIVAAGYALGVYDFRLLKRSLRNLFVATIASLLVSTVYFYISPFKEVQSELLARTTPTIYDILIAFFGGLVGVISVTRLEKGNPIPGVAIATALMPPLCTAGFGLATGHFTFFFGAFFLFLINCVFICIATFIIIRLLRFPPVQQIDTKHQKQVRYAITTIIILILVPSTYFAYSLYKQQQFKISVNAYIEKEFVDKGNTVVYKKTNYNSNPKTIELAFLEHRFNNTEIRNFEEKLHTYGIIGTRLVIKQDSTDNIQNLKNSILNEIEGNTVEVDEKEEHIKELESEIAKNVFDNKQILLEAKTIFPTLTAISLANHAYYFQNDSNAKGTVLVYKAIKDLPSTDKQKLIDWLKKRLSLNSLSIFYDGKN